MTKANKLLIFFLSLGSSLLTAQDVGKVIIKNGKDSYPKFIVSLNGVRPSNEYQNSVTFDYLDEYSYKVSILQAGSKNTLNFMVYSAPNYLSTYVINKDAYGNFLFNQESRKLMNDTSTAGPVASTANTLAPTGTATATTTKPGELIDEGEYFDIIKTLKKESLEKNRLEMAKTFFGDKWLLTSMVQDAIKIFHVETNRLAFAKFAYNRTTDKQNYFKVFDSFTASNSKKVMNDYIKTNP